MSTARQYSWLFFSLSGRVGRTPYALAAALSYIVRMLPFYQFLKYPEGSAQSEMWSAIFLVAILLSLWANVALSVKRLHDAGMPGGFAAISIFLDIIAIVGFALIKGTEGPNRYGAETNRPQ